MTLGVAGMEVARTATIRGHEVTLYEASDKLGGNVIPSGAHSFKQPMQKLIQWYEQELKDLNVPVKLNSKATADMLKKSNADAVVLAVGSVPVMPRITGIDKAVSSIDALLGKSKIGQKVVVVGGGLVGCEMALEYAMEGKIVTVVEAIDSILSAGAPVPIMNKMALEDLLDHYKVDIRTGSRIEEINDNESVITVDGDRTTISADTVVIAIGFKSVSSRAQDLFGCGADIYEIGDGRKVGTVMS